jgi:hypothetical protein
MLINHRPRYLKFPTVGDDRCPNRRPYADRVVETFSFAPSFRCRRPEKASCDVGALVCVTMPDTKTGRERNGRNKRAQLRRRLYEVEIESLDEDADLPEFGEGEGS